MKQLKNLFFNDCKKVFLFVLKCSMIQVNNLYVDLVH